MVEAISQLDPKVTRYLRNGTVIGFCIFIAILLYSTALTGSQQFSFIVIDFILILPCCLILLIFWQRPSTLLYIWRQEQKAAMRTIGLTQIPDFSESEIHALRGCEIVGGEFEYKINSPRSVVIAMFDNDNIVVRELFNNPEVKPGVHTFEYAFDATVYTDEFYYIRMIMNGDIALEGKPLIKRRRINESGIDIIMAIEPLRVGNEVQGAVVVEQTTNNILAEKKK